MNPVLKAACVLFGNGDPLLFKIIVVKAGTPDFCEIGIVILQPHIALFCFKIPFPIPSHFYESANMKALGRLQAQTHPPRAGGDGSLREHQAGIDEDVSVTHSHQHAVHAYLSQTADREHPNGRPFMTGRSGECPARGEVERRTQVFISIAALHETLGLVSRAASAAAAAATATTASSTCSGG